MRPVAALAVAVLTAATTGVVLASHAGQARADPVGTLNIVVPTSAYLGVGYTGQVLSASMGNVTVQDSRGNMERNRWVTTVSSTAYTTGGGGVGRTIANSSVAYWSGPVVSSTGGGILVPGQPTAAQAVTLNSARTAFSKTSGQGNNRVTWAPTLRITVPADVVAGLYSGTVTHSVA